MLEKNYNQLSFEKKIYELWEKSGFFNPDNLEKIASRKLKIENFSIIMPPPNANASLHIGHPMFVFLQDLMTRFNRQKGLITLWLPGTDHAGIATQVSFEKELAKKGLTRFDLGREKFFKECLKFTLNNKSNIENQFKLLGASCDWSRNSFTLDSKFFEPVYTVFKMLFDKGLIYRNKRLVNWCPRCQTVLSDLEIKYKEENVKLYYIKYPIENSKEFIIVATTRPETMLGDTAIGVNPKDKKYKDLINKNAVLPLINRVIPIIADDLVEDSFGTGAVKITPAHDPIDYKIGLAHKLEFIRVIDFDNTITKNGNEYSGFNKIEARNKIIEDLKKLNLLEKIEDYKTSISQCERCSEVIEPMISKQWFIKTDELAKNAINAVKKGAIKIIPIRFAKNYFNWMENIQDWCISRQLWWGHQIPVYYCGSSGLTKLQKLMNKISDTKGCGKFFISIKKPTNCPFCKNTNLIQDPDTLDTWFSSGQWPFNTLGWINNSNDFKRFYPTTVMETAYDILFFWVARMIMLGLFVTGKAPFKYVYLHGLIRDGSGDKMSKSKGNAIDPIPVIEKYGADSLRVAMLSNTSSGQDAVISENKIQAGRNFINKIWNIANFVLSQTESKKIFSQILLDKNDFIENLKNNDLPIQWIISKFEELKVASQNHFDKFNFGMVFESIHVFIWSLYADWFVEIIKIENTKRNSRLEIGIQIFYEYIILAHAYLPFLTEAIYSEIKKNIGLTNEKDLLIIKHLPKKRENLINKENSQKFEELIKIIKYIRNIISFYQIKNSFDIYLEESKGNMLFKENQEILKHFIKSKFLFKKPDNALKLIAKKFENVLLYIDISKAIDFKKEKIRLDKDQKNLTKSIKQKEQLLSNENFIKKAPKDLIEQEKSKLSILKENYKKNLEFLKIIN